MKEKIKIFYNNEKDNFILDLIASVIIMIIGCIVDIVPFFFYAILRIIFKIIFLIIKFIYYRNSY